MTIAGDFAEYLTEQARSSTAAFHEFRLQYEENSIHAFFEGDEDFLYYLPDIRARVGKRTLCAYRCGGKTGVIEVREIIRAQQYDDAICLYFIDRDYDDLFGCQPQADHFTYLTDEYSIENSLVCPDAIEVVLIDLAKLSKLEARYKSIRSTFSNAHSRFVREIEPLLAWSIALREGGGKPNYNNVNLKNIFVVRADGEVCRAPDAFDSFRKAVTLPSAKVRFRDLLRWQRTLRTLPVKQRIRGKYEFWFLETFLITALSKNLGKGKRKMPAALQNRTLFETLSSRIQKSAKLEAFLDQAMRQHG